MTKNIDDLIALCQDDTVNSRGGNKKCWVFDDDIVLKGSVNLNEIDFIKETGTRLASEGVRIIPIVDYKITGNPDR